MATQRPTPTPTPSSPSDSVYRIIGIDPGTVVLGFAVVEVHPRSRRIVDMGVLKLASLGDHSRRLESIHRRLGEIIAQHQPRYMAIEAPFFGKNPQSMLKLGRAQGVCMAAAIGHGLEVREYAPRKIKQSITGNGNASKEQVAAMLANEFPLDASRHLADATDALGAAMCHYYQNRGGTVGLGKRFASWEAFAAANAGRMR